MKEFVQLVLAFVVATFIVGFVAWARRPHYISEKDQAAIKASRDPKPGLQIALSGPSDAGTRLIVLVGTCTECAVRSGDLKALSFEGCPSVTVVTNSDSVPSSVLDTTKVAAVVTRDEDIHRQLNGYFLPRAATIRDGKLAELQQQGEATRDFVERICQ